MKELTFRGKDRYRQLSRMPLAVLAFGLIVGGSSVVFRLGNPVVTCWMMGVGAAFVSLGIFIVLRSWTRVGAAGITICQGFGRRGRTYPWQEIRWVDIRETTNNHGTFLTVRIALADGRRRSLPALRHSSMDPYFYFHRDFARIVRWWERSTDPAARFVPPDTSLSRRAPTVLGMILVLLIALGVLLVTNQA